MVRKQKTAASKRVAVEEAVMNFERKWFVRMSEERKALWERPLPADWQRVEEFCSWNENEGSLDLYIDGKARVFLVGGKPFVQQLSYEWAMMFLGDMFHESEEGGDYEGMPAFYDAIAAALKGGAK